MKTCYKCGEYKKVRKIIDIDGKFFQPSNPLVIGSSAYWYDYICEDCDQAEKIMRKKGTEEERKQKKEEQKAWIKERDKILKKK